jgi:hypothetical protein
LKLLSPLFIDLLQVFYWASQLFCLVYWHIFAYLSSLPQADIPTIVVRASLPGASPESMSATVAAI